MLECFVVSYQLVPGNIKFSSSPKLVSDKHILLYLIYICFTYICLENVCCFLSVLIFQKCKWHYSYTIFYFFFLFAQYYGFKALSTFFCKCVMDCLLTDTWCALSTFYLPTHPGGGLSGCFLFAKNCCNTCPWMYPCVDFGENFSGIYSQDYNCLIINMHVLNLTKSSQITSL